MRIYIAVPYTKEDATVNIDKAFEAADSLLEKGHTPYIPHWAHFWHLISSEDCNFWLSYSKTFLLNWAQAVLKLEGKSEEANEEIGLAATLHLPVYYSIEEVPNASSE